MAYTNTVIQQLEQELDQERAEQNELRAALLRIAQTPCPENGCAAQPYAWQALGIENHTQLLSLVEEAC